MNHGKYHFSRRRLSLDLFFLLPRIFLCCSGAVEWKRPKKNGSAGIDEHEKRADFSSPAFGEAARWAANPPPTSTATETRRRRRSAQSHQPGLDDDAAHERPHQRRRGANLINDPSVSSVVRHDRPARDSRSTAAYGHKSWANSSCSPARPALIGRARQMHRPPTGDFRPAASVFAAAACGP